MSNYWELYESHPEFAMADRAMHDAWDEAIRLLPTAPSHDRAMAAILHVRKTMREFQNVGAYDTEPDSILVARVNKHYGTNFSRWDV